MINEPPSTRCMVRYKSFPSTLSFPAVWIVMSIRCNESGTTNLCRRAARGSTDVRNTIIVSHFRYTPIHQQFPCQTKIKLVPRTRFKEPFLLSCKPIIYKIKKRVKWSDFTRLLPVFYNLQKKNRCNLLIYSDLGGMWGSHSAKRRSQREKRARTWV